MNILKLLLNYWQSDDLTECFKQALSGLEKEPRNYCAVSRT